MNRPEVNCPTTLIISVETPRQPVSAYVHVRTLATQSDHFRPSYRQRRVNASGRRARAWNCSQPSWGPCCWSSGRVYFPNHGHSLHLWIARRPD